MATTGVRPTTAWYVPATDAATAQVTVVRCGRTLAMLADVPEGAVRAVWDGAQASASVTAVVDALAALPGVGLTTLPSFAAVTVDDDRRAHVLVRGEIRVTLESPVGRVEVDGSDVMTWQERRVDDVASVVLSQGPLDRGQSDAAVVVGHPAALPLVDGVVRAALVAVHLDRSRDADAPSDAAPAEPVPAEPVPAEPVPAEPVPAEPVPAEPVLAEPVPAEPVPAEPVSAEPEDLVSAPVERATAVPSSETVLPGTVRPETVPAETLLPSLAWSDDQGGPAHEVGVAAGADASSSTAPGVAQAGLPDEAEDAYAHLWGATVMRAVEDAAVRVDEDDEEAADTPVTEPAASAVPAPSVPTPAAPAPAVAGPAPASSGTSGLIAGIPSAWGGSAAAQASSPAVAPAPVAEPQSLDLDAVDLDAVDHDGHTVMSSALAHLRRAAAPEPEPVSSVVFGAQILGRTCAQGHVNPPSRDDCRACGTPLDGEAGPAPRPSLGRVRVAGGPVVDLDRPLVVGRRPRTPRSTAGEMPRLVAVSSPNQDISRSHVEVRLEGWHVLVTDLATTNGTVLHRDGQAPQRLHPSEGTLIVDGDVIDLGDGVTLTFEEIW